MIPEFTAERIQKQSYLEKNYSIQSKSAMHMSK